MRPVPLVCLADDSLYSDNFQNTYDLDPLNKALALCHTDVDASQQ